jgi:hypothetical protein
MIVGPADGSTRGDTTMAERHGMTPEEVVRRLLWEQRRFLREPLRWVVE